MELGVGETVLMKAVAQATGKRASVHRDRRAVIALQPKHLSLTVSDGIRLVPTNHWQRQPATSLPPFTVCFSVTRATIGQSQGGGAGERRFGPGG